ncbi:MAG: radical SAM protein [Bacteroidales bacterium]|nr:radical SAM protein [Bacteroidales bacterium]
MSAMLTNDYRKLLKINILVKSNKIKLLALYIASKLGLRHISVRIDPILACNLRCKMCSFSNESFRKTMKGNMTSDEMDGLAKTLFPRAFQVVIGCGAEPTLNPNYLRLIKLANLYKVPNISLVTNGMNLSLESINHLFESGLNELILSIHGVTKNVYENFMVNANYEHLIAILKLITKKKSEGNLTIPQIRINYTVNDDNLADLECFFDYFGEFDIQTLQIRPIRDIGGEYRKPISEKNYHYYQQVVSKLAQQSKKQNITIIAGEINENTKGNKAKKNVVIIDAVYCYISPNTASNLNIDWNNASFKEFQTANQWNKNLFSALFSNSTKTHPENILNYEVLN